MNYLSLLTHLGTILATVKATEAMVSEAITKKAPPTAATVKPWLESVEALFDTGIIVIPGISDADVSQGLKLIESQLYPSA